MQIALATTAPELAGGVAAQEAEETTELKQIVVLAASLPENRKVVYLDAVSWYLVGGGITSMQKTVDQLTNALNDG